jgi:hypothetical protein
MTEMTQHMADIIGAAQGDPGCRAMASILEEDEPQIYAAELFHCLDEGYVVRYGDFSGTVQVTTAGESARGAAISEGTVRA